MEIKRLERQSADGAELNLEALYRIAPSCFTEVADPATGELRHVVDFKALRQLLGDNAVEDADEMYQFTWPGKQKARLEAARPIDKTLRPLPKDSLNWDTTQNLYIEGDNLEVLKLLQNSYMGKVKMIYIDPPYNTGNDFVYNDDFSQSADDYAQASGDIDDLGNRYRKNTDSNGRFHSDWCSMIYPRLLIARSLLSEDGVIFISIDDQELYNLTKICNEIFGVNNFVSQINWVSKSGGSADEKLIIDGTEYILVYARSKNNLTLGKEPLKEDDERYSLSDQYIGTRGKYLLKKLDFRMTSLHYSEALNYPVIDPDGNELWPGGKSYRQDGGWNWRWSKEKMEWGKANGFLEFKRNQGSWTLNSKQYMLVDNQGKPTNRNMPYRNFISNTEVNTTQGSRLIAEIFGGKIFEYAKPISLLDRMLKIGNPDNGDIVLDFFSGSATTAHAIFLYNMAFGKTVKFILTQLVEETSGDSEARKSGFNSIPEIGKERIRRAGKKIKEENPLMTQDLDVGFRVFRCDSSNFEDVKKSPQAFQQGSLDLLIDNVKADRTDLDLLFGAMLSWGVELSLPMETIEVNGIKIYNVNDGDLVACFAPDVTEEVINKMADVHPMRVLFRDSCFSRDDQKINLFETFKQRLDRSEETAINNIRVI